MLVKLAAESHVPCFQERVGTRHPGYMIRDRLPWRLRARPSATLHEIQVCSEEQTCDLNSTGERGRRQDAVLVQQIRVSLIMLNGNRDSYLLLCAHLAREQFARKAYAPL